MSVCGVDGCVYALLSGDEIVLESLPLRVTTMVNSEEVMRMCKMLTGYALSGIGKQKVRWFSHYRKN